MDAEDVAAGDVGVAFGGAEAGVAKEVLDITNIGAAFQKVSCECMTKAMDRDFFENLGTADGFVKNVLGGTDSQVAACALAGEKPGLNTVKCAVFGDETGGSVRKKGTAIFAAFAKPDIDNLTG